jgi:hypothetical protein
MRVLVVHPEDSVTKGPWALSRWDLIVDLGWAGRSQNATWEANLDCPVRSLLEFANWHEDVPRMRHFCGVGIDRLIDSEGIDWWGLLAPSSYQPVYEFLLLQKLASEMAANAEVRVTRPYYLADALSKMLKTNIDPFVARSERSTSVRLSSFAKKLRNLTSAQIIQIAFDKWDADYGVRRYFSRYQRRLGSGQRILLPTAYRNVSRVLTMYANLLPHQKFLMVATRADGKVENLPAHIGSMPLAAYAPKPRNKTTEREIESITRQWQIMKKKLYEAHPNLPITRGLFEGFDHTLRNCLRMRDAWRGVFDREEIGAVLCADENNPYTRVPVLLAQRRGLHTVYCSHGALDVNVLLRGMCSDTYVAKGEMESDYLANECGVPRERIFIGAPQERHFTTHAEDGTHIAFFSEPYELYHGRPESLYTELLPRLCVLAREYRRKVIVKLHPFESLTARSQLVKRVLTDYDQKFVEVTDVPFSEELLRKIWFSVTVESSVAVECALAEVPCFLCGWFDIDLYNYAREYAKFGAARILDDPDDVSRIPGLLESQRPNAEIRARLHCPITRHDFKAVLEGRAIAHIRT